MRGGDCNCNRQPKARGRIKWPLSTVASGDRMTAKSFLTVGLCYLFCFYTLQSGWYFILCQMGKDWWANQFRKGQCSTINSLILPYTGKLWGWSWALRRENVAFLCLTLPTWMMWPKFTKTKKISLPVLKHRIVHVLHNPQESCQ